MSEHEANTPAAGEGTATQTPQVSQVEAHATIQDGGQTAADTSTQGAGTPAIEGDTDQPHRESRAKERIQDLVRRAKEAEARAEAAERQLSTYQSDPIKEQHEYASDADYQRALIREELRGAERERLQRERETAAQTAQSERQSIYDARAGEVRARIPDFDQVAHSASVPYSQAMLQLVQESDLGPEIAYHLGKNPHEADRIARLSPLSAAREIGRLESRFASKAPPKVSSAPPPVKTIQGTGAIEPKPLEDLDYDAYYERRMGFKRKG